MVECPPCDMGLTTPEDEGHVCFSYEEQARRVAARRRHDSETGLIDMPRVALPSDGPPGNGEQIATPMEEPE